MDDERDTFLRGQAAAYARLALANVRRAYPAHVTYVATGPAPPPDPRALHPVFYGSYDWHSCVAMHWSLVRLARLYFDAVPLDTVRAALDEGLTAANVAGELAFFAASEHRAIQFPYGWGWTLALTHELRRWSDPDAARWADALAPLAALLATRLAAWLPPLTYPVRSGVHGNSAFGLLLALPYAEAHDPALHAAIAEAARRWFLADADYPAAWEPSGSDFLSPALTEAALLARALPAADFPAWLTRFLPGLASGAPVALLTPVFVSEATVGQIGHLHGLNLSRAWCFDQLRAVLPPADPRVPILRAAAATHTAAALPHVLGDDYLVEHWLINYAVLVGSEERRVVSSQ